MSRNGGSIQVAQDAAGIITAEAGMTFDFEIIDDGVPAEPGETTTDTEDPDNTATTTATVVSDDFNLNYVAFSTTLRSAL